MFGGSDRLNWRRSSRCASGGCVEVAETDVDGGGVVQVRSSQHPNRVMVITRPAWMVFVEAIRTGELTPPRSTDRSSAG